MLTFGNLYRLSRFGLIGYPFVDFRDCRIVKGVEAILDVQIGIWLAFHVNRDFEIVGRFVGTRKDDFDAAKVFARDKREDELLSGEIARQRSFER